MIELATFYGSEAVVEECKKLNYELKLPADISTISFREIAIMYFFSIFREDYDDVVDDLLHKMMELDAKKRIKVEEALEHDFFKDIRHMH